MSDNVGTGRLETGLGHTYPVELAESVSDPCAGLRSSDQIALARPRILIWLAEGARELTWALCSLSRERWTVIPPARLDAWPALRHVRHLALRESRLTLPMVRYLMGELPLEALHSVADFEREDAAWDGAGTAAAAETFIAELARTRFELLQRLEAAPDDLWKTVPRECRACRDRGPVSVDRLMQRARQHEFEHLAALWRIVLYWDAISPALSGSMGVPLHSPDGPEESC